MTERPYETIESWLEVVSKDNKYDSVPTNINGCPYISFSFEIFTKGEWKLIKANVRGYGIKYVMWEPFQVMAHISAVQSERPIRNLKVI